MCLRDVWQQNGNQKSKKKTTQQKWLLTARKTKWNKIFVRGHTHKEITQKRIYSVKPERIKLRKGFKSFFFTCERENNVQFQFNSIMSESFHFESRVRGEKEDSRRKAAAALNCVGKIDREMWIKQKDHKTSRCEIFFCWDLFTFWWPFAFFSSHRTRFVEGRRIFWAFSFRYLIYIYLLNVISR